MLNSAELKEIASMDGRNYFVSLYLNVDPIFNKKGDYMVHFKNMMKGTVEALDKAIYKRVKDDLAKIDNYVLSNKRMFKKGLALLGSSESSFWKEYHLGVPVRNELTIDNVPNIKPLLNILYNYQRYAVLVVDKESARIFVIHLGEIVEYGEVHTKDIPGKHKKGGWFALSQDHYERHIDYHVGLHLKDVVDRLDSFLSVEHIGKIIIGGSDEAVSMVRGMLHKTVLDKVIGPVRIEMFAKPDEVLNKVQSIVLEYDKKEEEKTIEDLVARTLKHDKAVLGINDVLDNLQKKRVMKLVILEDYKTSGYGCKSCGSLTAQMTDKCPFCQGKMESVNDIADLAEEMAILQDALVEVVAGSRILMDAGGIGAFLRF